jgi:hypothetical protein
MKKEYQIISAESPGQLSSVITLMLADNWELWGNPFALKWEICQAMVRFVEPETPKAVVMESVAGFVVGTPG